MGSKGWVAETFGELVKEVFATTWKSIEPKAFKEIIGGVN